MANEFEDLSLSEFQTLVDQNGLSKLFANRTRARILVTLFYTDGYLSVKEIANGANISQTAVQEATDQLERFEFLDEREPDDEQAEYRIDGSDPLAEQIEALAEMATNRFYDE